LLENLGLWGHLAADKFVPVELLSVSDRQVLVLLGALWNTDGCVDVFEEVRVDARQMKVRMAYVSRSQQLCDDVQRLLLRVGVPSTVTESSVEYEGERREVWTTKVVTRKGKRRFLSLIKEGRLNFIKYAVEDAISAIKDGDDEPIPSDLIRRCVPDEELTGILRQQVKNYRSVQTSFLALRGEKKASTAIKKLLSSDVTWERVAHVIVTGREMMYDITVAGAHNFVANDIITHNTSARFDGQALDGWRNDGEVIGQMMIWDKANLEQRFGRCQGVIVNMIGKQKQPQFERIIVPPQSWQLEAHENDLRYWRAVEAMNRATDTWPRSRASCITKYGFCDFYDHCSNDDSFGGGK
jgi:hypothetical protein